MTTVWENQSLTQTEQEVWETVKAFNRAFANNDPAAYFSYIDDDIIVITPASPYRVEGVDADREGFEYGLERNLTRLGYFQMLQTRVRVIGRAAVVTYYSRGTYGPEGRPAYLKETDVLEKRDDGWKIIHIHVSETG